MTESCETCKFWKRTQVQSKGNCRRYPPIHKADTSADVQPYTSATQWCGEYVEKNEQE